MALSLSILVCFSVLLYQNSQVLGDVICGGVRCSYHSRCTKINGTAKCICNTKCSSWMAPVCGSDGNTHGNQCLLRMRECLAQRRISIKHLGICGQRMNNKSIKEKACGDLPLPPQNSKFIKDQTGNYLVYCLHGYYRQGDARVRCRNGRWEVFAGCHEKTCSHPDEIKNGRVVSGQLHFGAKVSYDCDSCFYLSGPKERECLGNETWSGVKPVCKPIDCGPLVKEWNIENGMIFGRDTYCGSVLKFKCFEGFQLIGSRSVSCRENGKWSEDKPDCRRIQMDNTIKADAVIQCPQCKPKTDVCNEVLSSNFIFVGKKVAEDDFSFVLRIARIIKDSKGMARVHGYAKILKMSTDPGCFCFSNTTKGEVLVTGTYITSEGNYIALVSKEDDYAGRFKGMEQIRKCL